MFSKNRAYACLLSRVLLSTKMSVSVHEICDVAKTTSRVRLDLCPFVSGTRGGIELVTAFAYFCVNRGTRLKSVVHQVEEFVLT